MSASQGTRYVSCSLLGPSWQAHNITFIVSFGGTKTNCQTTRRPGPLLCFVEPLFLQVWPGAPKSKAQQAVFAVRSAPFVSENVKHDMVTGIYFGGHIHGRSFSMQVAADWLMLNKSPFIIFFFLSVLSVCFFYTLHIQALNTSLKRTLGDSSLFLHQDFPSIHNTHFLLKTQISFEYKLRPILKLILEFLL